MSTANPYVATQSGTNWAEGSGELTDARGLFTDAVTEHDALAAVFDTGGFALDVLGDIGDPLGAVIGCAVGWIVEHVAFLREPVNWLAGDPHSIEASTSTWANVSSALRKDATTYAQALNALSADDWSGVAADAYRRKATEWVDALDGAATMAEVESVLIAATGGLCAGFRGLIFTTISEAIERWVMVGLVALANSAWTFGASIAGWVIDVEIEAGLLAARISAKIAELIGKVGRIAETMGKDGGKLEKIGQKLVALSERMMHDVRSARSTLGWDRRYGNLDRSGHALHDGKHLFDSVHGADDLMHLGAGKRVLETTKNAAEVAVDPSTEHLDKLADGVAHTGADIGVDRTKGAMDGDEST